MRASSLHLRPDLDELRRLQRFIRRFCDRYGLDAALHSRVQLACEEWFVNVVKHGFGGGADGAEAASGGPRITAQFRMTRPDELMIRLTDNGPPFNPEEQPMPDLSLPAEQRPIGGLGVYLIRRLASRHRYERVDGRNEWTLYMTGERNNGSANGEEPT